MTEAIPNEDADNLDLFKADSSPELVTSQDAGSMKDGLQNDDMLNANFPKLNKDEQISIFTKFPTGQD